MHWCVYYGDGTSCSNEDSSLENVPSRNVQVIAQVDERVGHYYLTANDYYWWAGDHWTGGDIFGLFDYLIEPGFKKVLFGRTISNEEYTAIVTRVRNEHVFPEKSSHLPKEIVVK